MKIQYFVVLALPLFTSCAGHPSPKDNASDSVTITGYLSSVDTATGSEYPCPYDTGVFRLTTSALKKFDPVLTYSWSADSAAAFVPLKDNDTLVLHIGGCDHYTFRADYRTDTSKFDDEEYVIGKVKWMARNFFSDGFDTKYVECITRKRYKLDSDASAGMKWYNILDPDTAITDHIYEGFGIRKIGTRATIMVSGYIN